MRKIYNFVIKYAIYGLIFLIPLFWLPWTAEAFEFNKQYLLFVLVVLALLAWLTKMIVVRKKIVFRRTPLDIWILIFMLVVILSAIFSEDKTSSWLGFYGKFSDSAIGLLAMCLIYFLVVNNVARVKTKSSGQDLQKDLYSKGQKTCSPGICLRTVVGLVLASGWLAVLAAYLSIFNIWSKISGLLNVEFSNIMSFRSFNLFGSSLEGLSIFLAALIGLVTGMFLQKKKRGALVKIFSYGLLAVAVVLLVIINFWAAWVSLSVAMLFLLLIAFWTRIFRKRVNALMLPIFLLIVAGIFLFNLPGQVGLDLPKELILDNETTSAITWQSLKAEPILGSGQGSFLNNFAQFKPVEFNNSQFWNIRFDKGSNYLMEMAGTMGILGILSYLIVVLMFLLIASLSLWKLKKSAQLQTVVSDKLVILPFILFWLVLFVSQFVYPQNTALLFYFWLFTALGIVSLQGVQDEPYKKLSFSFKKLPEVGLVVNILLLILVFVIAGSFYLGGKFYLAEIKSAQVVADNQELINRAEEIVNLNRYRASYRQNLSQVYLISAWEEARKAEAERNIQLLQTLAAGSVQQARVATDLSPNSVSAWENLGAVYRDARGLIGGTLPFALEAYKKASALEPSNPLFYRELCRIRLIMEEGGMDSGSKAGMTEGAEGMDSGSKAGMTERERWDETVAYCQKAVDLKANYLDAHIQLALVYEKKGELEEALARMSSILAKLKGVSFQRGSELAGAATEIYFQIGRLHFNLEHNQDAIKMFEQAVIISPEYANGRYALALSYKNAGRNADALIQFKIVDQLVPGNETILAIIGQLEF